MKESYFDITGGLFLSFDASSDEERLLKNIKEALIGGVDVVGLYNTQEIKGRSHELINTINSEVGKFDVPLIVKDHWSMLNEAHFDGVYFSGIPDNFEGIKQKLVVDFLFGVECSSLEDIIWSNNNESDFSVLNVADFNSEELIKLSKANFRTLFLTGISDHEMLGQFTNISFDGVLVGNGDFKDQNMLRVTEKYKSKINSIFTHE